MPSPAVWWNWVQTLIFIQWNGLTYFMTLNEKSFRLTRKNKQPSQEEYCMLHLFTDWSTKKNQNQMIITAERWYLGKWKPSIAGVITWETDNSSHCFLATETFVCRVCLSLKETIERIYTPTKTKSPENRQNLATRRSSCLNNADVKPRDNSPGKAGWLLLILPLNYIQKEYKLKTVKILFR